MSEETKVTVSEEMEKFITYIEGLSVLEVSELVKALEERLGVSAAAPVAVGAVGPVADAGAAEEEQTEFTVVLTDVGAKKIAVIKVVRAITGLGLKEAKALVDGTPNNVKEDVPKEEAEEIKKQIEEAGGSVELK